MIVVDLGYFGHGVYDSIGSLIERYSPELVYGFDPLGDDAVLRRGATTVVTRKLAAWVFHGVVPFTVSGTGSHVGKGKPVPCFDLCQWLETLPGAVVLKMDVEGAEYALVKQIKQTRTDTRLAALVVEKHGEGFWPELRCPVEEWWM